MLLHSCLPQYFRLIKFSYYELLSWWFFLVTNDEDDEEEIIAEHCDGGGGSEFDAIIGAIEDIVVGDTFQELQLGLLEQYHHHFEVRLVVAAQLLTGMILSLMTGYRGEQASLHRSLPNVHNRNRGIHNYRAIAGRIRVKIVHFPVRLLNNTDYQKCM